MRDDLKRLNETWNRAWLEKDAATVERLMSPDYLYVAPNGEMLDRAALLEIIRSPTYHISWGTHTEVEIQPLGTDAGFVLHRWQGEVSYEGKSFKEDHRCTMLCKRTDGEWWVVLEQCSPIVG
jgi:uncharacterized protein (TIGR02246 family)